MSTTTKSRKSVKLIARIANLQTIGKNRTDPAALWDLSKRILFYVARKVRQAVRLKLESHGRGEAEEEELGHDAFICIVGALPRFKPPAAKLTTFVYGLARRRMWLVARAAFYGLSPEQLHRMDTAKRTPRYHRGERALRVTATGQREVIRPQGRCHPAALAGEGSVSHHDVLARGGQLCRGSPSPGA
jgi:hypothetical protein